MVADNYSKHWQYQALVFTVLNYLNINTISSYVRDMIGHLFSGKGVIRYVYNLKFLTVHFTCDTRCNKMNHVMPFSVLDKFIIAKLY